jgi:thiamine-phosphate pyrophosphorylase
VGTERVRQIRQVTQLPLVAIGGINRNNIISVIRGGADSVCLISAILNAPDITLAARELINIIEDSNEKTD